MDGRSSEVDGVMEQGPDLSMMNGAPPFAISVPSVWRILEPFGDVAILGEWESAIRQLYQVDDELLLRSQLNQVVTNLRSLGTVRLYSYVAIAENTMVAMIAMLNLLPIRRRVEENIDDFLLNLNATIEGPLSDTKNSMKSIEQGWASEFLRSEGVAEANPLSPWPASRSVRYLFPHPEGDGVAILTCSSPNISSREVVEVFDTVAKTFVWIPSGG